MDFKTFIESLRKDADFAAFDYEKAEDWEYELAQMHPADKYMIDIWADANTLIDKYKSGIEQCKLQQLLNTFHNRCGLLYQIYDGTDDLAYECKINEWLIHDYVIGNNEFDMNSDSVMKWFDEFYYHRKPQSQ